MTRHMNTVVWILERFSDLYSYRPDNTNNKDIHKGLLVSLNHNKDIDIYVCAIFFIYIS